MMLSLDPLRRFASALSLEGDQLLRADESDLFVIESPIEDGKLAAALRAEDVQQLLRAYGPAVRTLEVRLSDATRLDVREAGMQAAVEAFLEELDSDADYTIVCTIDKRQLAREAWPTAFNNTNLRVYFYSQTLERLLRRPLTFLENLLWPEGGYSKAVIVVIDGVAAMEGDFLAVVGANTSHPPADVSDDSASEYASWMASVAPRIVHWDREWPRVLTPRHMFVHAKDRSSGPVYRILEERLTDLSLLYLCDLTRERSGVATSFLFAKETVEICWTSLAVDSDDFAPGVIGLVEWVYDATYRESYMQDRRALVKENMARLLLAEIDASQRYALFAANATTVRSDSDAQWKTFRTRALTDYFRDLGEVEKDATAAAQSYADQTSSLTRALADSLVAAAAALVAALAAVVARPVSVEWVLRIIYAAYAVLTIGAGALNLSQISGRARALKTEFRLRTARTRGVVAPERMINPDRIERASRGRFWRWFWVVTAFYLVLVIGASVAAVTAPGPLGPLLVAPVATAVPPTPPSSDTGR